MNIFIAPHNDDETLFGSFTLLRDKPLVIVVYDGYVQGERGLDVTSGLRRAETNAACDILGVDVAYLGLRDDSYYNPGVIWQAVREVIRDAPVENIYIPGNESSGHAQHNLCARLGQYVKDLKVKSLVYYATYNTEGKRVTDMMVPVLRPEWIQKKLRALSCYRSQMDLDPRMGCWPHFLRDQNEYYMEIVKQ